ncbi:nitroreductase family protein [Ruminococcaceae bacterium OttesenSCG-928-A11]|nr:nitroreductase family protein [Ruminococcaceae bacterium OttesenSCG-928-A11]
MTDLEAIGARVSRRAYSGPLGRDDIARLEAAIARVNLDSGLSCRLLEDGAAAFGGVTKSYGLFTGVHSLILLAGHAGPNLAEAAGHAGERLVLEATKLGLGTCWVGGTFDRTKTAATLPEGETLVAVITAGPAKENKSFMERTVSRVAGGKHKPAAELCETVGEAPDWFMAGVNAAAAAPSAMNRQPVRFGWRDSTANARVESTDGLNLVDLGIAKLHFEIGAGGHFAPGNGAAFAKAD